MRQYILILYLLVYIIVPVQADVTASFPVRYNENTILLDDTTTWTGRMQRQLDSLINLPLFETTQLGLMVHDLTLGRDLFCVNHHHRMRPASCQKVITAITALHHLGSNYRLKTQVMLRGEIRDSVLWGDVYVVGGMDPMLSQGEVYGIAKALHEAGIDSISGILGLDLSFKNQNERGWGWCWDDDVTPLKPLLVDKHDKFESEFMDALNQAGIRGISPDRVVQETCPIGIQPFCEATHTMNDVLQRMMKKSDNYYAESLFYQLGAIGGRRNVGRKESSSYVDVLIRHIGLSPALYQIADGSGLSLYNYVTPELLVRMLAYAWGNEQIRESLYQSLPIAGVDGTLEKRMRRTAAQNNVHAKTGTVDGISSLSGYATSPEGHVLVFSIINQGVQKTSQGRDWQDKVCEVLCAP